MCNTCPLPAKSRPGDLNRGRQNEANKLKLSLAEDGATAVTVVVTGPDDGATLTDERTADHQCRSQHAPQDSWPCVLSTPPPEACQHLPGL
jgi:hypothetical protein